MIQSNLRNCLSCVLAYFCSLFHSNIAFPLLKKLAWEGDPQSKKVFKEEIAKLNNA